MTTIGSLDAPIEIFGGLVSDMAPADLPHGVSPDCQDVLFSSGGVATRPGLQALFGPLPGRKINGVGPKATEKLAALGIHTIGELAEADPGLLQDHFGQHYAAWLAEAAHGVDQRAVATRTETKSISRETTFERDLHARQNRDEFALARKYGLHVHIHLREVEKMEPKDVAVAKLCAAVERDRDIYSCVSSLA